MDYLFVKKVVDDFGREYYKVIVSVDGYKLAERFASQLCSLEVICLYFDGYANTHFSECFNVCSFEEFDRNLRIEF
jgi:hypothetical protein